jgi:hypothetical protein
MCLWAEGESVRVTAASATHDPDIWPPLEHSFSEEVDLLSPQPLFTPISSLGPATADSAALLAAHMWATERLAVAVEPEPVHSPRVATVDSQTERPSPREPQKKLVSMKRQEPVHIKKQLVGRKQEENTASAELEKFRLFD